MLTHHFIYGVNQEKLMLVQKENGVQQCVLPRGELGPGSGWGTEASAFGRRVGDSRSAESRQGAILEQSCDFSVSSSWSC